MSSDGAFLDNYALALAEAPTVRSHSISVKCLCILAKNRSTLSKHNCQTYKIMSELRLVMIAFTQRPVEFPYLFFLFVCLCPKRIFFLVILSSPSSTRIEITRL